MEKNMTYILDTSVVIKWYVEEKGSDIAERMLDDYKIGNLSIVEPDLLIYEFVNVLRYNKNFSKDERKRCIINLFNLDLYLVTPYIGLVESAKEIAEEKDVSVYDAIYISLADITGFEFVTADEKLYNKVKDLKYVKLLRNLK
ncbi:MAG: PIN domain nuclease [Armatimonadetes bacterium CG07_land_8_20_14_0_80_40_9]|nr:MAG: PIN domain nuclease [Armatimonadetes bacterium CG07_land_8_20_14_0_80_40_9]